MMLTEHNPEPESRDCQFFSQNCINMPLSGGILLQVESQGSREGSVAQEAGHDCCPRHPLQQLSTGSFDVTLTQGFGFNTV